MYNSPIEIVALEENGSMRILGRLLVLLPLIAGSTPVTAEEGFLHNGVTAHRGNSG